MIRAHDNLSTLDFMRALSTLVVVGIHYLGMTGRFQGVLGALPRVVVLMFFVHTSFVLMLSLERQQSESPAGLWRRFMVRRFFRVYPLTLVVLGVIVLFSIPSRIVPPQFEFLRLDPLSLLSNFLLTMNLTGSRALLSPLWSLPYEFQLYFLLPGLFLLVNRWRGPAPAFALWCATVALALVQPLVPSAGRLDILQFVPCIAAGILCYQLSKTFEARLPFAVWPALMVGIMCIGIGSPNQNHWPPWIACFLIAVTAPFIRQARYGVVRSASHWVAQHSYGIYLSHYFCLWLAFRTNGFPALAQWLIFLLAIVLLPVVLYRCIEQPMIRLGHGLTAASVR